MPGTFGAWQTSFDTRTVPSSRSSFSRFKSFPSTEKRPAISQFCRVRRELSGYRTERASLTFIWWGTLYSILTGKYILRVDYLSSDFLIFFTSERCRFEAKIFSCALLDLFLFCLRIFSIACLFLLFSRDCNSSILSHSSRLAKNRFNSRERSFWHLISIPVGMCLM